MDTDWIRRTQLEAYRQHWEQMRHAESQRLQYTAFYAVVLGAVVGLSRSPTQMLAVEPLLTILLVGLAIFGFVLSIRTATAIERHRDCAERMAERLTDSSDVKDFVAHWREKGVRRLATFKMVFPLLYFFITVILLVDLLG